MLIRGVTKRHVSRQAETEDILFKNQIKSFCPPCDLYLPALEEDNVRHPGWIPDQNRTGTDGTAAALTVQHTTTRGFHLHT
jgi:hypothetical protein